MRATVVAVLVTVLVGGWLVADVGAAPVAGRPADTGAAAAPHALAPGSTGNLTSRLDGLSCVTAVECVAVGGGGSPPTSTQTLAESWNGSSWGVVPTPSPSTYLNDLLSVSCTGPTRCVAAGSTTVGIDPETLVESWDGSAWTVVPTPNVTGKVNILNGVSCTSPTSCVAVGAAWVEDIFDFQTVIERWNGVTWSIDPTTGPAGVGYLSDVSCVNSSDCVAAGWDNSGHTLVLAWDGTSWSVVPSPSVAGSDNALYGVTCLSAADCVAVGVSAAYTTGTGSTLVEAWDGKNWSIQTTAGATGIGDALNHVSCSSDHACVATGFHFAPGDSGPQLTLAESWNGSAWSIVPSPSPSATRNNLQNVSCSSPTSCLAVGWYYDAIGDPGNPQTLVESWNGSAWTVVPSPNLDALVEPVTGMASTPTGNGYWLVDSAGDVVARGGARLYGSMSGMHLNATMEHLVATPDGGGYWLVAADGGIFSFGDARFYGSMGGRPLNAPVVGMTPTPTGRGYWLVASDGGVFAFGDAAFHGSMGGKVLNEPVVGIATDRGTGGYWLVASDGGIFSFAAPFLGSTGDLVLHRPVTAMAPTADGAGYWLAATDGGIFAFGDATFHGSTGGTTLAAPVVGMATDAATGGYWLIASDGGVFSFAAPFYGAG